MKVQLLADGRLSSEVAVGIMSRSIEWVRASKYEK